MMRKTNRSVYFFQGERDLIGGSLLFEARSIAVPPCLGIGCLHIVHSCSRGQSGVGNWILSETQYNTMKLTIVNYYFNTAILETARCGARLRALAQQALYGITAPSLGRD